MSNLVMWSLIVGFLLPPIQAIIQQSHWTATIRAVVNFLVCCVVALGVVYFEGNVTWRKWIDSVLLVLVTAISVYKGLWKPVGVTPAIEERTTLSRQTRP
jgi:hypothetical protein